MQNWNSDQAKSIPAHLYTHILVFSSPNNFPQQALHDKDLSMRTTLYVVAVAVLSMPLSITSCNEKVIAENKAQTLN